MTREPIMVMNIRGLKCDAPGCGWADMGIPVGDYPLHINRACPKCGANVLTTADFRAVYRMMRITNWMNRWLWWLPRTSRPKTYSASMNGSGKTRFVEKAPPDRRERDA